MTTSMGRIPHFHGLWMDSLVGSITRDPCMLDRISFFQQATLANALGNRLRLADRRSYAALAKNLLRNLDLFKEIEHVAPVLWSFATADQAMAHREFFDALR